MWQSQGICAGVIAWVNVLMSLGVNRIKITMAFGQSMRSDFTGRGFPRTRETEQSWRGSWDLRPGLTVLQIASGIIQEPGLERSWLKGIKQGGSKGEHHRGRALIPPSPQQGSWGGHCWPHIQSWDGQDLCLEGSISPHVCKQPSRMFLLCSCQKTKYSSLWYFRCGSVRPFLTSTVPFYC